MVDKMKVFDYDKIKSMQKVKKTKQLSATFIFVCVLIKKHPDLFGPLHLLHINEKSTILV